jgi:putative ABC transport system permease protein
VARSLALKQVLKCWLFGIRAGDPATYLVAVILTLSVIAAAVYLPARRAVTVDPLTALREE